MALCRNRLLLLAVAGALATALLAGCGDPDTVVEEAAEEGPVAAAAMLGEPVTVRAEVEEILSLHAFTVGDGETLVFSPAVLTVDVEEEVVVTGTVRQLVFADFRDDYDWFDFGDEDWVADFEHDLVVVADSIRVVG